MIPKLLVLASVERRLKGAPLHVLCYLYGTRKYGVKFPVKHFEVAEMIGTKPQTVGKALRVLVNEGYLGEGPRLERNIGTYELLITREQRAKRSA